MQERRSVLSLKPLLHIGGFCRRSAAVQKPWMNAVERHKAQTRPWVNAAERHWAPIGFRSRFSQCVDYMRFNEKSFCFRWQETTKLMLFGNTKTSSLVILCDLRYLTGNISLVMTKHMGVQRKLLISLFKLIYAFIHKFLMLFCRSILVLCHQHQR